MKQCLMQENLPIFAVELDKGSCGFEDIDQLVDYFVTSIKQDDRARLITVFDHYAHTMGLNDGQVNPDILAAQNIVFCFGITLPDPAALALRPRSIGVADVGDRYIVSFLESPMPVVNTLVEGWMKSLLKEAA